MSILAALSGTAIKVRSDLLDPPLSRRKLQTASSSAADLGVTI
jgi:hypothetical protein